MRMNIYNKVIFTLLAAVMLTNLGCSSGGDSTPAITTTFSWAAGIYTGTFTESISNTSGNAVLLVTSDNRFALAATDASEFNIIGTVSDSNLSTGAGFVATLTAALSGTYRDSVTGLSGTFTLTDLGIYDRTSDLSELVGQWSDTDNLILYTIQASGDFDAVIGQCTAEQGTFATIDGNKNEYEFTLNVVACPGLEGTFTGLAFRDDIPPGTDNQIVIIAENTTLAPPVFILSAPVK